jgi:hypothetical protein
MLFLIVINIFLHLVDQLIITRGRLNSGVVMSGQGAAHPGWHYLEGGKILQ